MYTGIIERTNTHAPREHSVEHTSPYRTLIEERGADPTGSDLFELSRSLAEFTHKCNFRPGVAIIPVCVMSVK